MAALLPATLGCQVPVRVCVCVCVRACACMCQCVCVSQCACVSAYVWVCARGHICALIHTYIHTYVRSLHNLHTYTDAGEPLNNMYAQLRMTQPKYNMVNIIK